MERKQRERRRGVISIEATIALSAFLFFMMFLYSILFLVMGKESIDTALARSAESLALDTYATEKFEGRWESVGGLLSSFLQISNFSTTDFTSGQKWYEDAGETEKTIEARFYGYLAGDETSAQELMKSVGVSNLSFQGSQTDSNGNLVIQVQYEIEPTFNFFQMLSQTVQRTRYVKLWGDVS